MERMRGFTLIELMVTVVLLSILLVIGVPSFNALMQNNRATTSTNNLVTALSLARSEAVKRGGAVQVAPASGTNWAQGWVVRVASSGEVIREFPALRGDASLGANASSVAFAADGTVDNPDPTTQVAACFDLQFPGAQQPRMVQVKTTGAVVTQVGASCP